MPHASDRDWPATAPHVVEPGYSTGTLDQMADDIVRRREGLGFSYVGFSGGSWRELAPIVDRPAGT